MPTRPTAPPVVRHERGVALPAELAVHPSDGPTGHELYFMCDDLEATMSELQIKGVDPTHDVSEERWGRLIRVRLPGGGEVGIYEPRHPLEIYL